MARSVTEFLKQNGYVVYESGEFNAHQFEAIKRIGGTEVNFKRRDGIYSFWLDNSSRSAALCNITIVGEYNSFPVMLDVAYNRMNALYHASIYLYATNILHGKEEITDLIEKAMGEWE